MSTETPKGYESILADLRHDIEKKWRTEKELNDKLDWILARADKYAAFCGTTRESILKAWETKRDSWWFGYYAEHKQPDPESLTGYPVMLYKDWLEKGKEMYGPDMLNWKFKCPACGHVQTLREFHDAGVDPDYGTANCASRFGIGGKPDCKWTTGGLLSIGGLYVINANYIPVLVFDFADSIDENEKSFKPGDIVQIRGLEGPMNGKSGEVVSAHPDGTVDVKIAELRIDGMSGVKTDVTLFSVPAESLVFDEEVTRKLREKGHGVIYR